MTRNTKILAVVLSCMLVFCLIMGIVIRNSYVGYATFEQMEETENLREYQVRLNDVEEYDNFTSSAEDYKELEKMSDLIVKVSATNERKLFPHTVTKTKVIIEEVYKGEAKKGQSVFIYEPAFFSYYMSKSFESIGGYQLMENGKEYFLFLRKLDVSEGYKMSDKEKNTYLPSAVSYSKFPVQEGEVKTVNKQRLDNGGYRYGEILDLEIITSKKEILSKYKRIKEEVNSLSR